MWVCTPHPTHRTCTAHRPYAICSSQPAMGGPCSEGPQLRVSAAASPRGGGLRDLCSGKTGEDGPEEGCAARRQGCCWSRECTEAFVCCRPLPVHSTLCPPAGVWREKPRGVHDGPEAPAEDEEGLDAHRAAPLRPLWGRYGLSELGWPGRWLGGSLLPASTCLLPVGPHSAVETSGLTAGVQSCDQPCPHAESLLQRAP